MARSPRHAAHHGLCFPSWAWEPMAREPQRLCVPSGVRLLLVGDSTMRYQFIALQHALRHQSEGLGLGVNPNP